MPAKKEIDAQLDEIRQHHQKPGYRCWGWGAASIHGDSRAEKCHVCRRWWATHLYHDRQFLCSGCALWRHLPSCPSLRRYAEA